jgi:hypothetical protein
LVEAGLARTDPSGLIGEHALLRMNGHGSYLVYPMADDPNWQQRLKQQAHQLFSDAANVDVQEPIPAPDPG